MDGKPGVNTDSAEAAQDPPDGTNIVSMINNGRATHATMAHIEDITPQYTASLNDIPITKHLRATTGNVDTTTSAIQIDEKKRKHNPNSSSDKIRKSSRVDNPTAMGKHSKHGDRPDKDKKKKHQSSHSTSSKQTLIENAFRAKTDPQTMDSSGSTIHINIGTPEPQATTSAAIPQAAPAVSDPIIIVDDDNIDDLSQQVSDTLKIHKTVKEGPELATSMPFFGRTVTIGSNNPAPPKKILPTYSQQLTHSGPQHKAPKKVTRAATPSYVSAKKTDKKLTEATQTSTVNLSFHEATTEPKFEILPQAENIWRQARACFVAHGKLSIRAEKLQEWAIQGLTPAWAVGTGPTPPHFLPKDSATITRLGDLYRQHACENLQVLTDGLLLEADKKEKEGQALYRSLTDLYDQDPSGLQRLTDIISRMVKKDVINTLTQLNRQEADLRANITCARDIYLMRQPAPRNQDSSGPRNNQRGRSRNTRSPNNTRSPSSRRTKRRRSNSRPRSNSRNKKSGGRRSPDQVAFSKFKQWLKSENN